MKLVLYIVFFLVYSITSSCVKNNPDPSWIYINPWVLQENQTNLEGELTHNITDAYLLIDDKLIGYFELPIKLPLLLDGAKKIAIYPAIHNNGIASTKRTYPFLQPYVLSTTLIKNQTLTINPTTKYYTQTKFWIENFEDAGLKLATDPDFSPLLTTGSNPSILKYGQKYGRIHLTTNNSKWMGETDKITLPQFGSEVFLEIDYMNTNNILTGVKSFGPNSFQTNPNIQLNAQSDATKKWKKIYIDLKEIISYSTNYNQFQQFIEAELDAGKDSSDIYIDNIKLVYF